MASPPPAPVLVSAPPDHPRRWLRLLPALVLLLTVGGTLLAYEVFEATLHHRARHAFAQRANEIAHRIGERLRDDAELLRGTAGLFRVLPEVTRADWRRYTASLRLSENARGIQGVGFAEWLPAAELDAHVERIRAEGFPEYTVWPLGPRDAYTSIVFLEPFDWRNQRAFGFDMYSERVRHEAMDRAMATGDVTLSARVTLVQEAETDRQPGALMYLPVFRGPVGDDPAERRAALRGFVYSPIRLKDLVLGALERIPPDVSFELYTAPTPLPDERAFASEELAPVGSGELEYENTSRIEAFGSQWSLVARGLPSFAAGVNRTTARAILGGGLLGSLGAFIVALAFVRRRAVAVVAAEARRESEARFHTFFDVPLVGAALTSPERGWLAVNDRMCTLLGYSREALLERTWSDVTHPDDLAADVAQFDRVLSGEIDGYTLEKRFVRRDGTPVWAGLALQCARDAAGRPKFFAALVEDLTARKREERIVAARLDLMDFALSHPLPEILVHTLVLMEGLSDSLIGFYHFVEPDGRTLRLQAWSTRTARDFCRAEGRGTHYDVSLAGVWADGVREGRPIIHNDYPGMIGKRGLPAGHAPVLRELVVPVTRSGRVLAVLGVGNKATDYDDDDLATVLRFADLAWDVAERAIVMERLRESDARFAIAFERAPVMMMLSRHDDGTYLEVNDAFLAASGFTRAEVIGRTSVETGWISAADRATLIEAAQASGQIDGLEMTMHAKDGRAVVSRYWGTVLTIGGEKRVFSIVQDMTAELALHHQLEQSQKLESVGRLAGGVAHDFNNMLSVIRGYTELLLQSAPAGTSLHEDLEEIRRAAERSAAITRQLLAFARKQAVEPRVLDLNDTVGGMLKMLRRLIGEDIDLTWIPGASLHRVRVDPAQIDQVLANLCVNARDAIDGVGQIAISTANVDLDAACCAGHEDVAPGAYVRLTVRDSGSGMPPEVLAHIFEPFFTTKEVGQGTGLGLATVYGIVRQNHGCIDVETAPGAGATFHLYLPAAPEAVTAREAAPLAPRGPRGHGELVLLVEDEPAVLRLCDQLLRRLGYRVLATASPREAERLAAMHGPELRLLLTDMVMPGMSGDELAQRVAAHAPEVPCLFMSGYTADRTHGVPRGERVTFIQKPFDLRSLAAHLERALATAALTEG